LNELDLNGMGRLLALTPNHQVNSLVALHFAEVFGRTEVYQLANSQHARQTQGADGTVPRHLRGRTLFGRPTTYHDLADRIAAGGDIKVTKLTREFDYQDFPRTYGADALPLFVITGAGRLHVMTAEDRFVIDAELATGERLQLDLVPR